MSATNTTSPNDSPPATRWRLWIDGCGGFLLLTGESWSVGGLSQEDLADVCVRADWPRRAGTIHRRGSDYFWKGSRATDQRELISANRPLPIDGSATVTMTQPSPLSSSATLQLKPPHRFNEHVDGVVLVDETLLVGPQSDCHVRCHEATDRVVLNRRGERWLGKAGLAGDFEELRAGHRITLGSLAMTLEKA